MTCFDTLRKQCCTTLPSSAKHIKTGLYGRLSLALACCAVLFLLPGTLSAQEVYFSISGGTMPLSSGDDTGQYDYWIRPAPDVESPRPARIEIFDAGVGGDADVILGGAASTQTTYSLFEASTLYIIDEQNEHMRPAIGPEEVLPPALETIDVLDERRYLNRWVSFFDLDPETAAQQGSVMRVQTDDGNDINTYQIRLRGPGAGDWELIPLNLSVGLINSEPRNRFQFRPLWDNRLPEMEVEGEEDSNVFVMDAFGTRYELGDTASFPEERFDKRNGWALVMTGSEIRINNRVTRGTEEIVPFYFDPVQLNESALPEARINAVNGGPEACFEYGLEASYTGAVLNLREAEWRTDGQTFSGSSFTYTFPDYGTYDYTALIPVRGRHVPRYQVQQGSLRVNQPPVLEVSGYEEIIAPRDRITLDASASYNPDADTAPDGGALSYSWFLNGELRSEADRLNFSTSVSGDYSIRLRVSDNAPDAACTVSEKEFPVRVNTQPYAEIDFKDVIAPDVDEPAVVQHEDDADDDPLQFTWEGEGLEGGSESGRQVSVRHETPGRYVLRLITDDQTGTRNARYTTEVSYKVNAAPVPQFSIPDIIAPGTPLALDGSDSFDPDEEDQAGLRYTWELSDGRTLGGPLQEIDFEQPGDYEITLRLDDGTGVENSVQELTESIRINAAPVAVIEAPAQSNSSIVDFDASESSDEDQEIAGYEWDFGDGNTATGMQVRHTYNSFGTYEVTLTVDDGTNVGNSRQSTTHELRVNQAPVALFSAPEVVAPGQTITLDGTESYDEDGHVTRWSWFLNEQEIGRGEELEYRIDEPGVYDIALEVQDDSPFEDAVSSIARPVRVNAPPVPRWRGTPAITEPGRETVFDASATTDADTPAEELQYRWTFSDGEVREGRRITRTFSEPGMAYFSLQVDDGEGVANSIQEVEGELRVNQAPIIVTEPRVRSNSRSVQLNAAESYDPEGRALDIRWELPDGSTREEASFIWTAPETGVHALNLRIDDGEGLDNSVAAQKVEVIINNPPVAVTEERIDTCTEQVNIFSSARSYDPDGDSFTTEWDFGDGNHSREANPVHAYQEPGRYKVRLALDDGFVEEPVTAEIPVVVEASPQAEIAELPAEVCANTPIRFDGGNSTDPNGIIESYNWTFGDGTQAGGVSPTHIFTEAGTYEVVLTVTGSGTGNCPNVSQKRVEIQVVAAPEVQFSLPEVVAPGDVIALDASSSQYDDAVEATEWRIFRDEALVAEANEMSEEISLDEPGDYEVEFTLQTANEAGCGTVSLTRRLRVNEAPQLVWNLPEAWPQHQPFRLSADGSQDTDGVIESYRWFLNGEEFSNGLSTGLPVDEFGVQEIRLVARDEAGVANSSAELRGEVYINPPPEPGFTLPGVVYEGERVALQPVHSTDAAGNALESAWLLDGEPMEEPEFIAEGGRHSITLTQADGRELPNSMQSVQKKLRVIQAPERQRVEKAITIPDRIIAGHQLEAGEMSLPDDVVLLSDDGDVVQSWLAPSVGETSAESTLMLGWQPRENGDVLATYSFSLMVFEPLQTTETIDELRQEAVFNPLNNRVLMQAPALNRGTAHPLRYVWADAATGAEVASGPRAHLPAPEGRSAYVLRISESENTAGRQTLEIPVIIETER